MPGFYTGQWFFLILALVVTGIYVFIGEGVLVFRSAPFVFGFGFMIMRAFKTVWLRRH